MAKHDAFTAVKQDIENGTLSRLYVFYGEESYLKQFYLRQLKEHFGSEDGFNYDSFDPQSITPERLQNAVESLPFLSERKLIVVHDVDVFKPGEALGSVLEPLLSDLPPHICLVFSYDTLPFKADARTKAYAAVTKAGRIVEFAVQGQRELIPWLRRRFRALEREVDPSLCDYMIFRFGPQMHGLAGEVEKIAAFAKDKNITQADIDAVGTPILDAVVYEMTDALLTRNMTLAFDKLLILLQMREEPISLLAAIGKSLRGLYVAQCAKAAGASVDEVMRVCSYHARYPAQKLMQNASRRSPTWCRRALKLCREMDVAFKSSGLRGDERGRSLEWLLSRLSEDETVKAHG